MMGQRLEKGDTIGLVAPASAESEETIQNGIQFFEDLGFNIKKGSNIYKRSGYLAGSDKERSDNLKSMFLDKSVKMILCVRGGYGTMRTLPYIDFNIIKNNPKIFVGFSDVTTYLNNFYQKCNLLCFHGPMLTTKFDDTTLKSLMDTLMNGYKPYTISNPENIKAQFYFPESVDGTLVGGNLNLICSTLGTDYEIDTKDKILFIEDVNEAPYAIDRMLTQLILAGKLQQCKGFILGQFKGCSLPHYKRSFTLDEIIEDRVLKLQKPTLSNFMVGHDYPRLTLPIGAKIRLNAQTNSIDVLQGVVS
ncbi:MAG: LD-carboxypeptidase [Clostridium sp.]|nr:LD-carboxypeptidase [Clostridium sp.]